ncbi:MAG: hypothetical protein R3275_04970 [Saprospiraceae bacterium]|nr:hypothetical protein [Saprospiraceae bacterium]
MSGAQSLSHAVMEMFGPDERGIWIRQYEGKMDELSYAYMVLGHNEKEYQGIIQQKGLPDWHLEGTYDPDTLNLLVIDALDDVIGFIRGTIGDSLVSATYLNQKKDLQRDLKLYRVLKHQSTELCGENKWLRTFEGQLKDEKIKVILQKEEESQVAGMIYFTDQNISYDLLGSCEDGDCREIVFELTTDSGDRPMEMRYELDENGNSWIEYKNQISTPLRKLQDMRMVCGSRFFRGSRISYVFPYFENRRVDDWLKAQANDWLSLFKENEKFDDGEYRFWVDLDFVGSRLISGTINFIHPNDETVSRYSFILPTTEDEPIEITDWISDDKAFLEQLDKTRTTYKKTLLTHEPHSAQDWIEAQTFKHISFRPEGLCLKTGYSPIYGERMVIIPWEEVEPHIKRFVNLKKYLR